MIPLHRSLQSLQDAAFNPLQAVQCLKHAQVCGYFPDRENDMNTLVETVGTLRAEAVNKHEAVREHKRTSVQQYFATIEGQARTFAEDQMVVDLMQGLRAAFPGG